MSCIEVLPFHQRKGYGKFLIEFSYELSLIEKKPGGPETPLSDLGRASYISWWTQRIITFIRHHKNDTYSIADITKETCILEKDIMETLVSREGETNIEGRERERVILKCLSIKTNYRNWRQIKLSLYFIRVHNKIKVNLFLQLFLIY